MGEIYKITNRHNSKCYIGLTRSSLEERLNNPVWGHFKRAFEECHNTKLYCAMRKYGKDGFDYDVIESDIQDISELKAREIYWIAYYDSYHNGYNMTPGGDCFILTEEQRKKISKALKGRPSPFRGKKLSVEQKKRVSEGLKAYWADEEKSAALRQSRASQEYKDKMSIISTEVRQRPEFKAKMHDIMHSKTYHNNMSKAVKKAFENEETRAKLSASQRKLYESQEMRDKISVAVKKAFEDEGMRQRHKEGIHRALQNEELHKKLSENTRKMNLGRKHINKDGIVKYVKQDELQSYIDKGWTLGRKRK